MSTHTESRPSIEERVSDEIFLAMQEVPIGSFAPPARRARGTDRAALSVQITLCILVAALLFSVIALPKLKTAPADNATEPAPQATTGGH